MARDSPATTIASHSPKKGGFQAAGRRSPDSSLPSKISTEACRSRWKAFLWRNGERGRKALGTGRGRPEPCRSLLRHRPLWPGRGRLKGSPPSQTVDGLIVGSMTRGLLPATSPGHRMSLYSAGRAWEKRFPESPINQRRPAAMPGTSLQILVRETGLEPVWINRWILSPVRLPIPPLSQR